MACITIRIKSKSLFTKIQVALCKKCNLMMVLSDLNTFQ